MNCSEFERLWNEVLDARSEGPAGLERDLEGHAASCEPCRAISARCQVLRLAVAALEPPPAVSAESVERLRSLRVPSAARDRPSRLLRFWLPMASAAALLALTRLGDYGPRTPSWPEPAGSTALPRAEPSRPLQAALADATTATLDLAREASAPAARIGREALDLDDLDLAISSSSSEPAAPASDLFQSVGDRVNAGVRPISGSARHAFRFLLGPPPEPAPPPAPARDGL